MRVNKNTYNKNKLVLLTNPDFKTSNKKECSSEHHPSISNVFDAFEDIRYEQLCKLSDATFPDNTIYVCDMADKSCYKPLEYLEISQATDTIYMTAEVNFRLSEWSFSMNLLTFVESLRASIYKDCSITSTQENLFDEDLLHIKFKIQDTRYQNLPLIIQGFANELQKAQQVIFSKHAEKRLSLLGA